MRNFILIPLLALGLGCAQTSVKKQAGKMNLEKEKSHLMKKLDIGLENYIGNWILEKETRGCFPIKIEKGLAEGTVKITRKSSVTTVSKSSPFGSSPENTISDYPNYKLSNSTVSKLIRGKIISGHIWTPHTNDWLGVGLRTWSLEKGVLIKKKAGLTMQSRSDKTPKENNVFDLDRGDVMVKWRVECKYIRDIPEK